MEAALARTLAERLRLPYPLTVLGTLESAWLAMRGRFAEAQRLASATAGLAERTAVPHRAEAIMSSIGGVLLWQGRARGRAAVAHRSDRAHDPPGQPPPCSCSLAGAPARRGHGLSRAEPRSPLETEDFLMLFRLAVAAEAALVLRLPALGAQAYTAMAPVRGPRRRRRQRHRARAGQRVPGARCRGDGERATAARHADEALERCAAWGLGPVAAWLRGHRVRAGF